MLVITYISFFHFLELLAEIRKYKYFMNFMDYAQIVDRERSCTLKYSNFHSWYELESSNKKSLIKHQSLMRLNYIQLLNSQCRSHSDLLCHRLGTFFFLFSLGVTYSPISTQSKPHSFTKSLFFRLLKGCPSFHDVTSYAKNNQKQPGASGKRCGANFVSRHL